MKSLKIILMLCIVANSSAVSAQDKPSGSEEMIKFRQSAMMFMRWNVGKIKKQVVKNPASYNKKDVEAAARAIAAVANSGIDKLFTTASATGNGWKETRVRQEYFQQPDKVKERFARLTSEANKLAETAGSGDIEVIKSQFNRLFTACRNCHKRYRK